MNQLQSELRLARSIVEEKDAEIQRIRSANNQVCFKSRVTLSNWNLFAINNELVKKLHCSISFHVVIYRPNKSGPF